MIARVLTAWCLMALCVVIHASAVIDTTTGYGDRVLPKEWRLVGGVEALTGILMYGWFTAFGFAGVSRMSQARAGTERH
jgi:hypothetical protein